MMSLNTKIEIREEMNESIVAIINRRILSLQRKITIHEGKEWDAQNIPKTIRNGSHAHQQMGDCEMSSGC